MNALTNRDEGSHAGRVPQHELSAGSVMFVSAPRTARADPQTGTQAGRLTDQGEPSRRHLLVSAIHSGAPIDCNSQSACSCRHLVGREEVSERGDEERSDGVMPNANFTSPSDKQGASSVL